MSRVKIMDLTSENVRAIFLDCLFQKGELENNPEIIEVEGIFSRFGFHPGRLRKHKDDILQLLMQLPTEFRRSIGEGWSFVNACSTSTGHQWGEHENAEHLLVLGLGLNLIEYCVPRQYWDALPGKMPYFVIKI